VADRLCHTSSVDRAAAFHVEPFGRGVVPQPPPRPFFLPRCLSEARGGDFLATATFLIPPELTRDLDALRLSLIRMRPDEFEAAQFESIRSDISSIRLQLKRLDLERRAIQADVERVRRAARDGVA
jgi:hypothetical protein